MYWSAYAGQGDDGDNNDDDDDDDDDDTNDDDNGGDTDSHSLGCPTGARMAGSHP